MKINELQMYLNLNTPDFDKPILFTYDMLYGNGVPQKNYKLPYFSNNIAYSKATEIRYYTYGEIVELFFNKTKFLNTFQNVEEQKTQEDMKKNSSKNIEFMMTLLFPTTFPILNNSTNSTKMFDTTVFQTNWFEIIKNQFKNKRYSYLKINGKVCTIIRSVWLNDVFNNPLYRDLMNLIKIYFVESDKEKKKNVFGEVENFLKECNTIIQNTELKTKLETMQTDNNKITTQNSTVLQIKQNIQTLLDTIQLIQTTIDEIVAKIKPTTTPPTDIFKNLKEENITDSISIIENKKTFNAISLVEPLFDDKYFFSVIQNFKTLFKISNKIKYTLKLKTEFFDKGKIDLDIENHQQPDIVSKITAFPPYQNLITKIKDYINPNYVSDNIELQKMIENYSKNLDDENKMIRFVNTLFTKINDNEMKNIMDEKIFTNKTLDSEFESLAKTNVANNIEKGFTEIHVLIDVLEGEINDANKGQFGCQLKSESLGIQTKNMFNPKNEFDILKKRIPATLFLLLPKEKKGGMKKTIKHKHNKIKKNRKQKKKTFKRHTIV